MSYQGIADLARDADFQARVEACVLIECQENLDIPDEPDQQNCAYDALRGAQHVVTGFIRIVAQDPNIIGKAEPVGRTTPQPGGGAAPPSYTPPDQTLLDDSDIQASVKIAFPIVSSMWYNPDGTPWGGAIGGPPLIVSPSAPDPWPLPLNTP